MSEKKGEQAPSKKFETYCTAGYYCGLDPDDEAHEDDSAAKGDVRGDDVVIADDITDMSGTVGVRGDGNNVNGDGCNVDCTLPACGSGILDSGEDADDHSYIAGDGCDTNCTYTACGNGIVVPGEDCDDGNVAAETGSKGSGAVPAPSLPCYCFLPPDWDRRVQQHMFDCEVSLFFSQHGQSAGGAGGTTTTTTTTTDSAKRRARNKAKAARRRRRKAR